MSNRLAVITEQLQQMDDTEYYKEYQKKFQGGATWRNVGGVFGSCKPSFHHMPKDVHQVQQIVKGVAQRRREQLNRSASNSGAATTPRGGGGGESEADLFKGASSTKNRPRSSSSSSSAASRFVPPDCPAALTIRAAGIGHSPNGISFTSGHMIHTAFLNRIIKLDPAHDTFTCQAGCTLAQIHAVLDGQGYMLIGCPSITNLTIGGVIATATHGSGINVPNLSASLVEAVLVNGEGSIITASAITGENKELLPALRCNLGLLGILVQLTLKVDKKTLWKMISEPISIPKLSKVLTSRVTLTEYYRFWWVPHTGMCYESLAHKLQPRDEEGKASTVAPASVVTTAGVQRPRSGTTSSKATTTPRGSGKSVRGGGEGSGTSISGTSVVAAANAGSKNNNGGGGSVAGSGGGNEQEDKAKARNLGRFLTMLRKTRGVESGYEEWLQEEDHWTTRATKALRGDWLKHNVTEAALMLTAKQPSLQPLINKLYQKIFLNDSETKYGTIAEIQTFDVLFQQYGSEWSIPAHQCWDAFEAIQQLVSRNNLHVHWPVEFRFVDEDDTWLSPNYQRKTCYIGLVMFRPYDGNDAPDTLKFFSMVQELMMKQFKGRPHWGKWFELTGERDFSKMYPKYRDFMALRHQMDPMGLFVNDWCKTVVPQ